MNDMLIPIRGQNMHLKMKGCDSLPILVLLHGFTGTSETWTEIIDAFDGKYKTIAVDLTGHGKSAIPKNPKRYSMEEQLADLDALFDNLKIKNFTLIGYSMGGRIALAYTLKYPNRVDSLILESASPGLKTESERLARQEADKKLSDRILNEGISSFVEFWENIPLFNSQKKMPEEKQLAVRKERLGQDATGLANSLLGIGTGSQPSYWEALHAITIPVLLITGEYDTKFVNIAWEMKKHLPQAEHCTIEKVGHAIHVENPTLFATMIEEHVTKVLTIGR